MPRIVERDTALNRHNAATVSVGRDDLMMVECTVLMFNDISRHVGNSQ